VRSEERSCDPFIYRFYFLGAGGGSSTYMSQNAIGFEFETPFLITWTFIVLSYAALAA
jgi:hypothetical protein